MQRQGIFGTPPPAPIIMRKTDQRQHNVTLDALDRKRARIFVIVSQPIRLSEGAAPSRGILIFDDHPATIRLLDEVDRAQKRENILTLVGFSALIVLLILAMFGPLF